MTTPVRTRSYRSPRRQEQAAATRRSVLRAARDLFTRDGYAATTVTAIAAAAGVSLDTVYASVGRKPELVLAVIDQVLASSDEPVDVEEREYVKEIRRAGTARAKLEIYAAAVGRLVPQIAPLQDALRRAAESDAACAAVWAGMLEQRGANVLLWPATCAPPASCAPTSPTRRWPTSSGPPTRSSTTCCWPAAAGRPSATRGCSPTCGAGRCWGPLPHDPHGTARAHGAVGDRAAPGWLAICGPGHGAMAGPTHPIDLEGALMARVAVTGGSGKLGRAVVADLVAHGYDVLNLDQAPPPGQLARLRTRIDLTDYGQVVEALTGDRRPARRRRRRRAPRRRSRRPGSPPNAATFDNNILQHATTCSRRRAPAGIRNVVWASSETVLGLPFDTPPPYVPVDEDYPARPETTYSLGKHLEEEMAAQFCRLGSAG